VGIYVEEKKSPFYSLYEIYTVHQYYNKAAASSRPAGNFVYITVLLTYPSPSPTPSPYKYRVLLASPLAIIFKFLYLLHSKYLNERTVWLIAKVVGLHLAANSKCSRERPGSVSVIGMSRAKVVPVRLKFNCHILCSSCKQHFTCNLNSYSYTCFYLTLSPRLSSAQTILGVCMLNFYDRH